VISGDPDLIREFTRRGYAPGMLPVQPPPHPGLETLFWDLIEGFSRPPREALDGG
jgi:redox-sensitive bicupin YhaK (pirin superfamily)